MSGSDKPLDKTPIYIGLALLMCCCCVVVIIGVYFLFFKKDKELTPPTVKEPDTPTPEPNGIVMDTYIKDVFGNDGTVSCDKYCGGYNSKSYDGVPSSWYGAQCIGTNIGDCTTAPQRPITCRCMKKASGWFS